MTRDEHRKKLSVWLSSVAAPDLNKYQLSEALYAFIELGLFPDNVSVSPEQALMCYKIVEAVSFLGFPEEMQV